MCLSDMSDPFVPIWGTSLPAEPPWVLRPFVASAVRAVAPLTFLKGIELPPLALPSLKQNSCISTLSSKTNNSSKALAANFILRSPRSF